MRISDWISAVCSSGLLAAGPGRLGHHPVAEVHGDVVGPVVAGAVVPADEVARLGLGEAGHRCAGAQLVGAHPPQLPAEAAHQVLGEAGAVAAGRRVDAAPHVGDSTVLLTVRVELRLVAALALDSDTRLGGAD